MGGETTFRTQSGGKGPARMFHQHPALLARSARLPCCARSACSTYCKSTPARASVARLVSTHFALRKAPGVVKKAG
jgi:hypothetical protein